VTKTAPALAADTYACWRATPLGAITERLETRLVFDLAGPLNGKRVLDVGSGDGQYALEAATRGGQVTALDRDQSMLYAAHLRARALGLRLQLHRGDATLLPFPDGSFDVVLAVAVLCLVPDAAQAVREMARALRPGGRLLLGDLGRFNLWAAKRRVQSWLGASFWRHVSFRSRRQLCALVRAAGLDIVATRGAVHYPPSTLAARLLAPIDPLLSRVHAPGAAFLALAAVKPGPEN
jgi:SAM-dependent methyltransferase